MYRYKSLAALGVCVSFSTGMYVEQYIHVVSGGERGMKRKEGRGGDPRLFAYVGTAPVQAARSRVLYSGLRVFCFVLFLACLGRLWKRL